MEKDYYLYTKGLCIYPFMYVQDNLSQKKKYEVEGRTDFISLPLQPKGKTERSFRVYIPQIDAK